MILKSLFVYPKLPENLGKLHKLASNLWCTWNYQAIRLFYRIDPQLFRAVNHNPIEFLVKLPKERIRQLSHDRGFLFELDEVWQQFQQYMQYDERFKTTYDSVLNHDDIVAYFAMEFGLHECIPIYGGGLGILSGDFLKAASDVNMPVVGVGLVYKYGYFTQRITATGEQYEQSAEFDNHLIPMHEARGPEGDLAYIEMRMLDQTVMVKLWQIDVGKTRLILLDTDLEENPAHLRDITQELYVADRTKRFQQEMLLGIGGVRALERLGIKPRIYHINEGHSALLILARLQQLMLREKHSFPEAKALIRASTVFTTHTPVIAGNETFDTGLVKQYIEPEVQTLGLSFEDLASHAFIDGDTKSFWLPALAMRFARHLNAVSKMHGDVSRRMWASLYRGQPRVEIPIDYVTNGVHHSWLSESFIDLFKRHVGTDYIRSACDCQAWDRIQGIQDDEIWEAHHRNKQSLITFIRKKLADDLAARGYIESKVAKLTRALNPEYLTIVYARRFARYKRATLILRDKERLAKILTNPTKPVQLIFAGKAHPADGLGKSMIREIIEFAKSYHLEDRVVFVENYDMNVARHLVWGADVWLNNPVKENEASGTSGMKAAINGVLNMSVLDGWWPEGYNGRNGWAIRGAEYSNQPEMQETAEAEQIYDLIEAEISEYYYDRNEAGIPTRWVEMMKQSVCSVCSQFNMNRVLAEYMDKFYAPAKTLVEDLGRDNCASLKQALHDAQEITRLWDSISIGGLTTSVDKKDVVAEGEHVEVACAVDLNGTPAKLFDVELFYMLRDTNEHRVIPMRPRNASDRPVVFECGFEIAGRGLLTINARIKPASPILKDLHPELVKWAS